MISAADLMLWGDSGLPIEKEPVVVPPAPNLRGDEVKFTRRDERGNIVSAGHMHRNEIAKEQNDPDAFAREGGRIQIEGDDHPGTPLVTEVLSPDPLSILGMVIRERLAASDRYFLGDSDLSDEQTAAWTKYRQSLRDALKETALPDALARLPASDPKCADPFAAFRTQIES